jgi:hypothetical protein
LKTLTTITIQFDNILIKEEMKSPLNISPGTIFILGATPFSSSYDIQDYRMAEDMTKAMNYEVVNPINIHDGVDMPTLYTEYHLVADWICFLAKTDKIVTINSYEQCPIASKMLKMAHTMGKTVIPADKFFQYIKA